MFFFHPKLWAKKKTTKKGEKRNIWQMPYERLLTNNLLFIKISIPVPLKADLFFGSFYRKTGRKQAKENKRAKEKY